MATLTVGTRVHHRVSDTPDAPRGHRDGTIVAIDDADGLVTVEWHEVADYLRDAAMRERERTGRYTGGRFHPSLLVAF